MSLQHTVPFRNILGHSWDVPWLSQDTLRCYRHATSIVSALSHVLHVECPGLSQDTLGCYRYGTSIVSALSHVLWDVLGRPRTL